MRGATTGRGRAKCHLTVPHSFPCGLVFNTQEDLNAALSALFFGRLYAAFRWSEAEDVVVESVASVSIGGVPVGLSEPVLGRQPSVQDLGVSTRHCQAAGTQRMMV